MFVLDTSAILSGSDFPDEELLTTDSVLGEIRPGGRTHRRLEYLMAAGLKARSPAPASLESIRKAASYTGDLKSLSETDLSVLALALETKGTILTDDYAIQNVAKRLKIPFKGVLLKGIEKEIEWQYRCTGCRKYLGEEAKVCHVCGADVVRVR